MANEEVAQPETKESIGQKLKRAREQRGLTETDVANAQHLRTGVIQAIESGDYKKIDSELFLKGYVRAYAKMVDLNADELIAGLDEELEPLRAAKKEAVESHPLVSIERRREKKRRVARGFFYTAMFALAAYLVVVFVLPKTDIELPTDLFSASTSSDAEEAVLDEAPGEENLVEPESVDVESTDPLAASDLEVELADEGSVESDVAEEPVKTDSVQGDESVGSSEPVAETESVVTDQGESVQGAEEQPPVIEDEVAGEGFSSAPAVTGESEVIEPEINVEVQAPAVETEVNQASGIEFAEPDSSIEEPVAEAPATTVATLEISFTGDCWVQVSDASGDRLVSALRRSGDRLELTGEAPLTVVIGAVDAVSAVQFNGQPVDLSNFRVVNNRSEFTLSL